MTRGRFSPGLSELPEFVYVVNGSRLERDGFTLRADRLITVYLEPVAEGEYVLENQGAGGAELQISGPEWTDAKVRRLDSEGRATEELTARAAGKALTFAASWKTTAPRRRATGFTWRATPPTPRSTAAPSETRGLSTRSFSGSAFEWDRE